MSADKEPITPFVSKIRALAARGTSCVLVIGGSGEYFEVADVVIAMESYAPRDVTAQAHAIAARYAAAAGGGGGAGGGGAIVMPAAVPASSYGSVADRTILSIHSRPAPGGGLGGFEGLLAERCVNVLLLLVVTSLREALLPLSWAPLLGPWCPS